MIPKEDITEIGRFLKPHGIKGEIGFLPSLEIDLKSLFCIIVYVDGIPVPFFIEEVRKKGRESFIIKIDGIDNEKEAAEYSNSEVYALKKDLPEEIKEEQDGFSAEDLIGFEIIDDDTEEKIGVVEYLDDSTDNWLFMVKPVVMNEKGNLLAIPVADEFITDIDPENKMMRMSLPQGLLEI